MVPLTIGRYFAKRFFGAAIGVFAGVFILVVLVDYIEMMRRAADIPNVSALTVAKTSFYRVPQVTERMLPFAILVGAMSCYLNLSRRLELVVARAAGMSAWQFVAPALITALLIGIFATTVYNPVSATLRERSKRLEADIFGERQSGLQQTGSGFWVRQRSDEGQAVINAKSSSGQGAQLLAVTIFTFDPEGHFRDRIEAKSAALQDGRWVLEQVRVFASGEPPRQLDSYSLRTTLTAEQVRESFATPETVSFWQLPSYIALADRAGLGAAGYRLQYQLLIARPFLLVGMVMLAASVSLRFFRFGGVPQMVLGGISAGFLLYVLSKVTEDLSKAELMHPIAAAWLPVLFGGLTGFVVLLYQEDG
ncbi:MAG TPA: LPS export ABC transporter permease LptG [Xanthobacteraceae bacterium]|jgi:lipopolysaccharide export system permease protein|nr:LPS export ABC transporter permease LptG [Xanthobacteraceae bacterium]